MKGSECPLNLQLSWREPHRLKLIDGGKRPRAISLQSTDLQKQVLELERQKSLLALGSSSQDLLSQMQQLEQDRASQDQHLDMLRLQLQRYHSMEEQMTSLHDAHLNVTQRLKEQKVSHEVQVRELQRQVDQLLMENRSLQEHMMLRSSGGGGGGGGDGGIGGGGGGEGGGALVAACCWRVAGPLGGTRGVSRRCWGRYRTSTGRRCVPSWTSSGSRPSVCWRKRRLGESW